MAIRWSALSFRCSPTAQPQPSGSGRLQKSRRLSEFCGRVRGRSRVGRQWSPTTMPPLLTEADVAKRLAISVRSVSRMRTAGGGPRYLKIKHSVRYCESDLGAWLAT
jgi:hypothetical protein